MSDIRVKRVYLPPEEKDGKRVLVDRLWPRGLAREAAALDLWLKEIAPSSELRKWFSHEPEKWPEFRERYFSELAAHPLEVQKLLELAKTGPLTLLYSAKDEKFNNAAALSEYLANLPA